MAADDEAITAGSVARPGVGLVIVGDEILSGKRQDKHLPEVVSLLARRGIELAWAHVVGDDEVAIARLLKRAGEDGDVVLCCGGIGATPDDVTRQAAARAAGRDLVLHPEGGAILQRKFGDAATPQRLRMAEFPAGAELVPNPVNEIAGFSVGHWYFVPGFPEMAWPMLSWVIDERLQALHDREPPQEYRLRIMGTTGESDLLHLMEEVLARFPPIRLSSLPTRGTAEQPRHIEFGIRGPATVAAAAYREFRDALHAECAGEVKELRAPDDLIDH